MFTDKVEEGAFVWLTVKFGLIRIIYKKEDLCEQMKNIDTDCPIEKGKVVITKVVELPKQIPPVGGLVRLLEAYAHNSYRELSRSWAMYTRRKRRRLHA